MTHLYLIRHGQAVSNVQPIIGGMDGDAGLTALGVKQAERLRDRLAATREIAADVLIASTLPRARQTAAIIAPALGVPITFDDDVHELRPGDADGMQEADAEAKYGRPDVFGDPFRPIFPGGESWPQFMLRVGTALDRITRQHADKTIVIVCHGGVIDGSFTYFFGLPSFGIPRAGFDTKNTSITHWERKTWGAMARWTLIHYNDDAHLRDSLRPAPNLEGTDRPGPQTPAEEDN